MGTHANKSEEHSIYTGTLPVAVEQKQDATDSDPNEIEITGMERKKYHSSAMYAASKWHNTVSHVKAHSHRSLDL